jgi:hypothetical protein
MKWPSLGAKKWKNIRFTKKKVLEDFFLFSIVFAVANYEGNLYKKTLHLLSLAYTNIIFEGNIAKFD